MALELHTGLICALKIMNKQKIREENLLVQFIRELKIQTFLDHPNIIKNYGWFSDQDNFYTIMELGCDGELYDVMGQGECLSEESTAYIIGSLLQAVNSMHRHKILHRDIKPENIVLIHVSSLPLRATSNSAISGGQSTKNNNSEAPSAEPPSTSPQNYSRELDTTKKSISGQSESSPSNFTSASPPSASSIRMTYKK